MLSILYSKFLDHLSTLSFYDILRGLSRLSLSVVLLLFLVDLRYFTSLTSMALKWHDFIIVKIIVSLFLVFGFSLWHNAISRAMEYIAESIVSLFNNESSDTELFYGIPCVEIVDYIFECEKFARSDIEKTFGLPRGRVEDMIRKLDDVGVFVRGENNSRVRNPDFSRSDIYSIIAKGEVRPLHRKVSDTLYTHKPSMPAILSRGGFTTRPLHAENLLQ